MNVTYMSLCTLENTDYLIQEYFHINVGEIFISEQLWFPNFNVVGCTKKVNNELSLSLAQKKLTESKLICQVVMLGQ